MCWKRLKEWFVSPIINTQSYATYAKLMQLWMEINVVTLHKVVKAMPQQMHSVIKAKGGPIQYYNVQLLFFAQAVYFLL